jgi:3-deoxy-D-arabino-heptulosonate 7-phosphate (DAHP) synthase
VQRLSHLPIIVDPSHGTGKRNKVTPLSRAAVAVGADGLMVEVHHQPDEAFSDGAQSVYPEQFARASRFAKNEYPKRLNTPTGWWNQRIPKQRSKPGSREPWNCER